MSQDNIVNSSCKLTINNSIAFDFDGTLVNCAIRQIEVLRSIIRRNNINLDGFGYNKWWKLKNNGLNTFDALIEMHIDTDLAIEINNSWNEIIENIEWLDLDILEDDVMPLLKKIKDLNKSIFIITARKSEYFFLNQINKLAINQYISKSFVVNPNKSKEQKKEILEYLKPSFFVGDTENDFYSAESAGIPFIAVSTGQRSKQFLLNHNIAHIIDNLSCFDIK